MVNWKNFTEFYINITMKYLNKVISEAVEKIVLEKKDLNDNVDLVKDLGLDSLDIVELYSILEETFNTRVSDEEISMHGTTVKDIKDLIRKYTKE